MPTFTYGTTSIDYTLCCKAAKRDCTISVDWKTGITVVVPEGIDQERIDAILRRKAPWILRKLAEFREIKPLSTRHEFISGEKISYLGRQYRLKVIARDDVTNVSLTFQSGRFIAVVPKSSSPTWRQERLRQAFRDWYIEHGLSKVEQRVNLFAPRIGVQPSKVVVKDQKTRWGSCTKNGTININWRILMAPMRIVDYVVVHELAHMIHADHSSDFWSVVASVMPDYDERKEWLRIHGPTLEL
ncbi:MAG: M48 family metallopeptidase [Alicyclobacillus sp.]|nr:M48 family metallopeptidase [Alicyclobacillus sp.]